MSILATGGNIGRKMTGDIIPRGFRKGQLQQFTPEQAQLFSQLFGHVGPGSFLSRLAKGEENIFDQVEAPALRQFSGLQGNIASRFSGMGSGARRSSGFQNAMGQSASDFAQQLQSQRLGLQRQAIQDLMGLSEALLEQRPTMRFLTEKPTSFLKQLGLGLSSAGSQAAGQFAGLGAAKMAGFI